MGSREAGRALKASVLAAITIFAVCVDPAGPISFEAEEGSGVVVPTPDVPNPVGELQVGGVVVELMEVRAFLTNTTQELERIHLCTYDCSSWDCRTLRSLHRDEFKVLAPNTGAIFQAEIPCLWHWEILRENDPETPATCRETYRWGEEHPRLERLASGSGHRRCSQY